jgi:succinoglycan biosynthesis protein ExoU
MRSGEWGALVTTIRPKASASPPAKGDASVDVIIAIWNRSDTVERAVLSALAEPEVQRVVVVDDGSTDDGAYRALRCCDKDGRVSVTRLQSNSGPAVARNVGIEMSNAEWISILDGDDFFLPGRVRSLLAVSEDADFVADDILQTDAGGVGIKLDEPPRDPTPWRLTLEAFVLGNMARRGGNRRELGFLKPIIRRSFLDLHRLRYDEILRLGEDYALYANALARGARFLVVPSCGYVAMTREDSISGRHSKQDLERHRDSDLSLASDVVLSAAERKAIKRHYQNVDVRVQWVAVIESLKARRPVDFLIPFFRSPTVTLALALKLADLCWSKGVTRIGGRRT